MRLEGDEEAPASGEREDDTAELTVADDEWPVPPEYRDAQPPVARAEPAPVTPPPEPPPPAGPRRMPPTVVPGLLGLALLLIVGGVVLAFALRGDPAAGERAQGDEPSPTPTTTTSTQATDTETTTSTPTVSIPDVIGLSRGRAEAELREAGLVADVRTSTSSRRPGTVLEQSPAAGARVDPESGVQLVVAAKPEPERVRVPRVVGLPVAEARARLREEGLRSTVTRVPSTHEAGTVVGQSPAAGSSVRERQVIRLEVSSVPVPVIVPDVVGLDEASARQELQAAGFSLRVLEEETSEPSEDGLVVAQRPLGGSRAESDATVTITVAVFV